MINKGGRGPHFHGESWEWGGNGYVRILRWEGLESEVKGLQPGLKVIATSTRVGRIGTTPLWFIEATLPGLSDVDPDLTESFELITNTVQQPARFSPVLQNKLSATEIGIVVKQVNKLKIDLTYTYAQASAAITAGVANAGAGRDLLDDMISGVNSFFSFEPVLRLTRSYKRSASLTVNYTNAGKIYTSTSAMLTGEGYNANVLTFTLPSKEWLKVYPQVRIQFEGRAEVVYEYWAADVWSRNYYSLA